MSSFRSFALSAAVATALLAGPAQAFDFADLAGAEIGQPQEFVVTQSRPVSPAIQALQDNVRVAETAGDDLQARQWRALVAAELATENAAIQVAALVR